MIGGKELRLDGKSDDSLFALQPGADGFPVHPDKPVCAGCLPGITKLHPAVSPLEVSGTNHLFCSGQNAVTVIAPW